MHKTTLFRIKKDKTRSYRRVEMRELVELLAESSYQDDINSYRNCYPLLQRETPEFRKSATDHLLQSVPFICFSTEMLRKNGVETTAGYSPLLMLTVSNLPAETATAVRNNAALLPYTRLAFIGVTGKDVVIVCELQALGVELLTSSDYQPLLYRANGIVRKVYADYLHVAIDVTEPLLNASCRMSSDADAYYNPLSTPFPVKPDAMETVRTTAMPTVESKDDVRFWRRIYVDNLQKAQSAVFTSEDPSYELLLLLARYCHETGMPQALAEAFAMHNGEFFNHKTLVMDTFASEYETELRNANAYKHLNATSQLMFRTSNFLNVHYRFRRNVLNGIVEYRLNDGSDFSYHLLTEEVQNTMTITALEAGLNSWDKDLNRYIHSKRIPEYDPVNDYLDTLPQWDGTDRIADLARRVPTDTPDWERNFHVWMLSMVAQWMGRDEQHGNAIAPILIGSQATGKSSFCRILLPEPLAEYYNDSIHFKDDKSVFLALSSFALINIDEFDSLSRTQQPLLKYLLSKTDVKYRAAYRNHIEQHKRYASFIGTTNNPKPLSDPTGSRRFLCVKVRGSIDFVTPIEYAQVYAQLREEVLRGDRYWFTKEESDIITMHNSPFQRATDMPTMLNMLFRQPRPNEHTKALTLSEIVDELVKVFPDYPMPENAGSKVGHALKKLGIQQVRTHDSRTYLLVRRVSAYR